jgi:hypothetical protein
MDYVGIDVHKNQKANLSLHPRGGYRTIAYEIWETTTRSRRRDCKTLVSERKEICSAWGLLAIVASSRSQCLRVIKCTNPMWADLDRPSAWYLSALPCLPCLSQQYSLDHVLLGKLIGVVELSFT